MRWSAFRVSCVITRRLALLEMRTGHFPVHCLLLMCLACDRPLTVDPAISSTTGPGQTEALPAVQFQLTTLDVAPDGTTRYLGEAEQTPGACAFEIVIGTTAEDAFAIAKAAFERRAGADCTELLEALGRALGFSGSLPTPAPIHRLEASIVVLGVNQSRDARGGLSSDPRGEWTATKLFVADGEGEVFLDLNPKKHLGEFSLKDQDCARTVITEFARILLPQRRAD